MEIRLPPPPFWRTAYFDRARRRPDRIGIPDALILSALAAPLRREVQPDGRIRHWAWAPSLGRWLRVVTLADGQTVHNAFFDRGFRS